MRESVEHANSSANENWTINDFTVTDMGVLKLSDIEYYDDFGSWGEWDYGELENLPRQDLEDEIESFRGENWKNRAMTWIDNDSIPPIVIIEFEDDDGKIVNIGDGRGRVSMMVGLNIPEVHTYYMKLKDM